MIKKTDTPINTKAANIIAPATKPAASNTSRAAETVKVNRALHGKENATHLFDKENLKWMLIGLVVIAVGFFVMAGGKSSNPNVFQDKDVYSFTRITVAPILIIAGFIIEIFAIMRKPSSLRSDV